MAWIAWRIANGVMGLVFALCVAVQYDDPDPLRWIAIYGAALVLCAQAARGVRWRLPPLLLGAIAAAWSLLLAPSLLGYLRSDRVSTAFYMKTGDVLEEEARECGGLLLVAGWSALLALDGRVNASRRPAARSRTR